MTDPKKDFRWKGPGGDVLQAYKVTPGSRWASQDWPDWLQTQSSAKEVNKVYTDPASPNQLFINLPEGRFAIEDNAYLIYDAGQFHVQRGEDFEEHYEKVVPFEPRNLDPESLPGFEQTHEVVDGKLVPLDKPVVVDLEGKSIEELYEEATEAINEMKSDLFVEGSSTLEPLRELEGGLMLSTADAGAVDELKQAYMLSLPHPAGDEVRAYLGECLINRANWCSCAPGSCDGERDVWECRKNSPLITGEANE